MAALRFFCSPSSLFVLMQIPMVPGVRCGSRPRDDGRKRVRTKVER
jgi:hypothetical protein